MSFTGKILAGLSTGVAAGLFFGEIAAPLNIAGDVFIGLLQMTVLPYIVLMPQLIENVQELFRRLHGPDTGRARRDARVSGTHDERRIPRRRGPRTDALDGTNGRRDVVPGLFWHVWAEFFPYTDINRSSNPA